MCGSTHGTNMYDFKLITVLVLDELGEGVPVAWMISNREDALALTPFFRKIREKCGDISTKVFMSDDADNFYNAWKSVFTVTNTKKLIIMCLACRPKLEKKFAKTHKHCI